ncbi:MULTISPECIES: hypothetical protein [unclassified Modicisalibacter]|uniref:hypothetical protein n=1 Tax=unclassified Modicisalibacter TaxID=2679913 RepID=UPI001CCC73FF|nr:MULTISPECIES: hypothetical protein [unclassified Modicisalibacter]MBZ9559885.1 hypothetical protein [Modicisalibacter sp. R2A 31.J]MBZ9577337.1 hypothetical protein [Modicisalibacter sp. MOD 31.J]
MSVSSLARWRNHALAVVLLACLALPQAVRAAASLAPFSATYRLHVDGWPDVTLHHRLTHDGGQWQSAMRASIAVAEGHELSRFRLAGDHLDALFYTSGYRLFGLGDDYRLSGRELDDLPDRQTTLIVLARRAPAASCVGADSEPCTLRYLDHRGDTVTLDYRVTERGDTLASGHRFPSVRVDTWRPDKPDRHLLLRFTPELPGLLLGAEYRREGKVVSTLELISLDR